MEQKHEQCVRICFSIVLKNYKPRKAVKLLRLDLCQRFSHLSWHQKPLEGMLNLDSSPELLIQKSGAGAQGSAFLTNSNIMLMRLTLDSHFENCLSMQCQGLDVLKDQKVDWDSQLTLYVQTVHIQHIIIFIIPTYVSLFFQNLMLFQIDICSIIFTQCPPKSYKYFVSSFFVYLICQFVRKEC